MTAHIEVIREGIKIYGALELVVERFDRVVHREVVKNTTMNAGLNAVRDMLLGEIGRSPRAIAAGTDDGTILAKAATNTGLGDEQFRKVIQRRDETSKRAKWQILMLPSEGNGVTYRESGLMKNSASGFASEVLFSRAFHTAIAKNSGTQITETWQWDLSGS